MSTLKSVSLIHGIMFGGQMMTQLTASYGNKLTLAANELSITAYNSVKNKTQVIPMTNVKEYTTCTVEEAAKLDAPPAPPPKPAPVRKGPGGKSVLGVEKFVKDETTGAIKTVIV